MPLFPTSLLCLFAATFANLFESYIGATLQVRSCAHVSAFDSDCAPHACIELLHLTCEVRNACMRRTHHQGRAGLDWMTNDVVNMIQVTVAALVSTLAALALGS